MLVLLVSIPLVVELVCVLTNAIARVIQEELLKDFANRSEMSDWFGREDEQKPEETLPLRPNLKNVQNEKKIGELEAQIKRYIHISWF